jgi:hypothetical protein
MTPIATVRDYNELHAALRARADALSVSRGATDDVSGLPSGYSGKLLGPKPLKLFGVKSLGAILTVLGLKMVLVDDEESLRKYTARLSKRHDASVRLLRTGRVIKWAKIGPEWARRMNAHRSLKLSPSRRIQIARTAARARGRTRQQVP